MCALSDELLTTEFGIGKRPFLGGGRTLKPTVAFVTLYPSYAGDRRELGNTRAFFEQYAQTDWPFELGLLVGSAHEAPLRACREMIDSDRCFESCAWTSTVFIDSQYAGTRAEEISDCKQKLATEAPKHKWDYLLFVDADIHFSLRYVPEWIGKVGADTGCNLIRVPYCMRDEGRLWAPDIAFGAFLHHREVCTIPGYADSIFPKKPDGTRLGAPDCALRQFLLSKGCRIVGDREAVTRHYTSVDTYRLYDRGRLGTHVEATERLGFDPEKHGMVPSVDSCARLQSLCRHLKVSSAVDIGGGAGNFMQSLLCAGARHLTVVEDRPEYMDRLVELAGRHDAQVDVRQCVVGDNGYELPPMREADLAVFDGPAQNAKARYATARQVRATHYVFHDAYRDQQEVMRFAAEADRPLDVCFLHSDRGLAWVCDSPSPGGVGRGVAHGGL